LKWVLRIHLKNCQEIYTPPKLNLKMKPWKRRLLLRTITGPHQDVFGPSKDLLRRCLGAQIHTDKIFGRLGYWYILLGGGNSKIFYSSSPFGEMIQFDLYFSKGLNSPTRLFSGSSREFSREYINENSYMVGPNQL